MVKIKTLKKYDDIELGRVVNRGEELEVSVNRAKKLVGMGLAELLIINKLSKREYYEITGRKKR